MIQLSAYSGDKSLPSSHPSQLLSAKELISGRFFFVILVILITSWMVYDINVNRLQHSRNFIRALHYHILNHQIIGVYWFGQGMINYPVNQYFQMNDLQDFLITMQTKMSHLDEITYGQINQTSLNQTVQKVLVQYQNGNVASFDWTLQNGIPQNQPFNINNIQQIKSTLVLSHSVHIQFEPINIGDNIWDIKFFIQPFSDTSIIVTVFMHQHVSLASYHILTFIAGILLAIFLLRQYLKKKNIGENFLYYFLCLFLIFSSILAFSEKFTFQFVFMIDGLTCCSAWLCAIKFYTKQDDYKLSFLLTKSYVMIGRLFASFGPLLIAFSMFAYCVFSRYSGQFSSFWRTFTSLFYICYYNMTYESAITTSRSNPISLIFFIVFVLLFTICIYSSMLVSIFCSYVWGKRQEQIKKDIVNNLKIQCSSCDHKYKYTEKGKIKSKVSFNLSEFLQINWNNPDECIKYKRVMCSRIKNLREKAEQIMDQSILIYRNNDLSREFSLKFMEDYWVKTRYIKNLIGEK